MICQRAAEVLGALLKGALSATPHEIDELAKAGLVVAIDGGALRAAADLVDMAATHGGLEGAPFDAVLTSPWLSSALHKLEANLKSELHRGVTAAEKLWEEEALRAQMRRMLGLVSDGRCVRGMRAALVARASIGKHPLVPVPGSSTCYGATWLGEQVLSGLAPRMARCAGEPLGAFLKRFMKSQAQMSQMAQAAARLQQGVGVVPKGKAQVVVGLLKTGLPPDHALAAYQRSYQLAQGAPPKERPHMAVTYARNAPNGAVEQAPAKLQRARMLVSGFPGVPDDSKNALARALLPFADPAEGLPRLRALFDGLVARNALGRADCARHAARLMGAKGEPTQVLRRLDTVARALASPPRRDARFWPIAVALASAIVDDAQIAPAVARFGQVVQALGHGRLPAGVDIHDTALSLAPCPGSPDELVHLLAQSAYAFSGGQQLGAEHVQMAAAFAKRFVY